jgi:flagellar hook assembly protein FlgD
VLIRAFPNPFAAGLTFEAVGELVHGLGIFDAKGRLVRNLVFDEGHTTASLHWDGQDDAGRDASPGVYYVRSLGATGGRASKIVRMR